MISRAAYLALASMLLPAMAARAQESLYFSNSWCPRPEEIAELQKHLVLTMKGCCIDRAVPKPGFNRSAIEPWRRKLFSSYYPNAQCLGEVLSADEELKRESEAAAAISATPAAATEKEAKSSQELEAQASQRGGYIIKDFGLWDVNSVGGVEPTVTFVNPRPESEIKYVTVRMAMYNAVGDMIRSSIGNSSIAELLFTGPLANSDGEHRAQWEPTWYNHSAACLRIVSVRVEYMDRRSRSYSRTSLRAALHPTLTNECKPRGRGQ